ncbi:hypothetical protein [Streptomyces sp. SS1-1]|uniref:hypothetical protein n=1 Tax=Streptomyces sp. SS1-1 TaxID=2651869 RepID=UPI001CEF80C7|nr:hypothetical protein [Streptomyces sp. SS1-1]
MVMPFMRRVLIKTPPGRVDLLVTRGLHRHGSALAGREADGRLYVGRVGGTDRERRLQENVQVVDPALGVVPLLAGQQDRAGRQQREFGRFGGRHGWQQIVKGHGFLVT